MKFEFQIERNVGTIEYNNTDGAIIVCFENDPEMRDKITNCLQNWKIKLVPFNNPGIPGYKKVVIPISCEADFIQALKDMEKKLEIWIHDPPESATPIRGMRPLTWMPWFNTKGIKFLKWNGDDDNPWWVIEDLGTGLQTFYEPHAHKHASLEWFRKSITDSGLVDHWDEFPEEFESLEKISYTRDWM